MADPAHIVQAQLDAFNAHDLEALLPLFADGVVIYDLADGSVVLHGLAEFRERYVAVFRDRPIVHAELVGRLQLGRFVVDRERLTDGDEHEPEDALAIYEVDPEGAITRMWFIEPEHRRTHPPGV